MLICRWLKELRVSDVLMIRFIFTSDPRGSLRLWRLGDALQSVSLESMKSCDVSLIAEFVSCFGTRIICLDASIEEEVFLSSFFSSHFSEDCLLCVFKMLI